MAEPVTILSHVVSSEALGAGCPRETLGLQCLAGTYPCLCELVTDSEFSTRGDEAGGPILATLTVTTASPAGVMEQLNFTGNVAHFEATSRSVRATFDLRKPENENLRAFLNEVL